MMNGPEISGAPKASGEPKKKRAAFEGMLGMAEKSAKEAQRRRENPEVITRTTEAPKSPEERERRERVEKLVDAAYALDNELFTSILPLEDFEESKQSLDAVDTMVNGDEVKRERLGETGINSISKRTFRLEGNPEVVAFVKPQSGEATFKYDPTTKQLMSVQHELGDNGSIGEKQTVYASYKEIGQGDMLKSTPEDVRAQIEDNAIVDHFKSRLEGGERIRKQIADYYGITPEEVPLKHDEFGPRVGIDAGDSVIREYTMSRINELVKFGVVPLTTLHAESLTKDVSTAEDKKLNRKVQEVTKNVDVASAQEAARGKEMSVKLFKELKEQGPKHKGAKSLMRLACLDYLGKTVDRHPKNIFYEDSTGQFSGLDNGLSGGLSRTYDARNEKGEPAKKSGPIDAYRSVAMELTEEHDDWALDEEAVIELMRIYDSTKNYLAAREKVGSIAGAGKEIKYLTNLFRLQYGNEKIAAKEGRDFFTRLEYLIKNRRPPKLSTEEQFRYDLHLAEDEEEKAA
ncbi:MAG: hypothetical protein WA001_01465 [Patescibacteria group bacterium]